MFRSKYIAVLFFAICAVGIALFELLPMVEYYRFNVQEGIILTDNCGCSCVSSMRPWYSTYNYWFWFWVMLVPVLVFSVGSDAKTRHQIFRTVLAVCLCYWAMDLAQQLMWDIRNGIFSDKILPNSFVVECVNSADGASLLYTRIFGWLYAIVYTGFWLMMWRKYHEKRTKLIKQKYQWDKFHQWIIKISIPAVWGFSLMVLPLVILIGLIDIIDWIKGEF